jgi:group I intron endonuclease
MAKHNLTKSGVYAITNIVDGLSYVGGTVDFTRRWRCHRKELRNGQHHSRTLQAAWEKYDGLASFKFSVLEYVADITLLQDREQHWIDTLHTAVNGYNIHMSSIGPRGITRTQETRDKIAAAKTGVPRPAEMVARMAILMTGRTASEETKALMREQRSGVPQRTKRGLTYDDAVEIRRLRDQDGLTQAQLAERFGVTRNPIREILAGRTYTAA